MANQKSKAETTNVPVATFKLGLVKACVWQNEPVPGIGTTSQFQDSTRKMESGLSQPVLVGMTCRLYVKSLIKHIRSSSVKALRQTKTDSPTTFLAGFTSRPFFTYEFQRGRRRNSS